MWLDRHAEEARAPLVLANGGQRAPERRIDQLRHRGDADREHRQGEIVERLVVAENVERREAEIDRQAVPAGQAVVAAGDRVPAEGEK
jgi:hypothetical protein